MLVNKIWCIISDKHSRTRTHTAELSVSTWEDLPPSMQKNAKILGLDRRLWKGNNRKLAPIMLTSW